MLPNYDERSHLRGNDPFINKIPWTGPPKRIYTTSYHTYTLIHAYVSFNILSKSTLLQVGVFGKGSASHLKVDTYTLWILKLETLPFPKDEMVVKY